VIRMRVAVPLVAACALAMQLATALAATPARTIGDLKPRHIDIRKDAQVNGSASRAMENYRRFLELANTDPAMRAEALRRLGDLNLESGELERLTNEVSQLDAQGAEAIKLYSTLLRVYPDYPRNDQVLYQLARAYETTGQAGQALATLDSIVQRFPASRDMGEVQFRRGELLFSAKRYAEAQAAYQQVINRGATGSAYFEQSHYKHGWTLFKQGLNEECLESFAKVLDLKLLKGMAAGSMRTLEQLGRADHELVDDTLRVSSIAFTYLDGSATLDALTTRRGKSAYDWLLYSRLGDLFVDKQRYQDAASTYRAFVAREPVDEHAPGLSMQAIEAYRKGGFAELVVEGKTEYANTYGLDKAFWKGRDPARYPSVLAELKTNLKDLSLHYHATAQKSKKIEDYNIAARWYGERLRYFPKDPDAAETNYALAEVLFESHQYDKAAAEYERSAYFYPRGDKSAAAGYAALVAYQKQEEALATADRPAWHARQVESALKFGDTFPEHAEVPVVLVRAAQDLFAAKDSARAVVVAEKLLARQPPVDAAKQRISWTIIAQTRFDAGDFARAEPAFASALAQTTLQQPEHADLTERLAATIYKQAEAKRSAGDDAGAADDFLRVGVLTPGSKAVVTAQYDAAAALINSKQWPRAVAVLEGYRRDYPKSEYAADITRKLAVAYVEVGKPAQAAVEFEAIAATSGEDPAIAREALTRAADLHAKAGNSARSEALLEQWVVKYPQPVADAVEVRARLAESAQKAGNATRLAYWRAEIIKADATAGAQRTDRTRFLAANARLAQVLPLRDAFRAVSLTAPLKKSLADKRKAMETAIKGFQEVANYAVATTTTAATYEMAELYRTLASDLMKSERPKKLSADEREQYDALLEEQAFPLEEQAITIHELNSVRTVDGIYDEPVRQSLAALAQLKPARFGKTEQSDKEFPGAGSEAALRGVIEQAPDNADAWNELGIVLRQGGKFGDARAAYAKALAANPRHAGAHRNLGVLLDIYFNEPAAALPEFISYKQLSGEEKPVSGWIAELRARTGIKEEAPPAPATSTDAPATSSDAPATAVAPPAAAPAPVATPVPLGKEGK
jgi:cellulose synthase operon protein C